MTDMIGAGKEPSVFKRMLDSDIFHSFKSSPITMVAAFVVLVMTLAALFAPLIAPMNPFDPAQVFLMNANIPPRWMNGGDPQFLLGTDDQGRDLYSAILYGLRVSIFVGVIGVAIACTIGVTLGLVAGFFGGRVDAMIMRIADVQLTFPAILIALLIDGIVRGLLKSATREDIAFSVLVVSIGLAFWVQYARTVRGATMVERHKEYVQAARITGVGALSIMRRHIMPNVLGPVLVLATIQVATAIITEATLSFLGVGAPPTSPSLGTLIRIGNDFLFSGEWWITVFPGVMLMLISLSINLLGDWLRDALNPRLQ